jgi:hypothetical protein
MCGTALGQLRYSNTAVLLLHTTRLHVSGGISALYARLRPLRRRAWLPQMPIILGSLVNCRR